MDFKAVLLVFTLALLMPSPTSGAFSYQLTFARFNSDFSSFKKPRNQFAGQVVYSHATLLSVVESEESIRIASKQNSNKMTLTQLPSDDPSSQKSEKAATSKACADSLLNLSQELANSRNFDKAESILETILADNPANVYALYQLAVVFSWAGKYNESIQAYKRLHKLQPENHGLLLEMAKVRLWKADRENDNSSFKEAVRLLESYLKLDPLNLTALKQLGYAYVHSGELTHAFRVLTIALERDPEDSESGYLLGQVLAYQGKYDKARSHFEQILDKHPQALNIRLAYADLLSWMSLYQESAKQYDMILETDPYNQGALIGLGHLKSMQGDFGSAEVYYNSALSGHQNVEGPLLEIGNLKLWQRQWDKAVGYYKKVLGINHKNRLAQRGLEDASWLNSPIITFVSGYFEDTRASKRYWVGGQMKDNNGDHVVVRITYLKWSFSEPERPTLSQNDVTVALQYYISRWLEGSSSLRALIFSNQEVSLSVRWASSLMATPVRSMKLYFSYGREPYMENLTVARTNYFFDIGGVGLDWELRKWLSTQLSYNKSWFNGTYSLGYYDPGIKSWITLSSYQDRSTKNEAMFQVSGRILNNPEIYLKHKYLTTDYRANGDVPYWAPSNLQQHITTIDIEKTFHNRLKLGVECRGIHTQSARELGFGISGTFLYRLKGILQTELSISYDKVHVNLPWEGLGGSFAFSLRL